MFFIHKYSFGALPMCQYAFTTIVTFFVLTLCPQICSLLLTCWHSLTRSTPCVSAWCSVSGDFIIPFKNNKDCFKQFEEAKCNRITQLQFSSEEQFIGYPSYYVKSCCHTCSSLSHHPKIIIDMLSPGVISTNMKTFQKIQFKTLTLIVSV